MGFTCFNSRLISLQRNPVRLPYKTWKSQLHGGSKPENTYKLCWLEATQQCKGYLETRRNFHFSLLWEIKVSSCQQSYQLAVPGLEDPKLVLILLLLPARRKVVVSYPCCYWAKVNPERIFWQIFCKARFSNQPSF